MEQEHEFITLTCKKCGRMTKGTVKLIEQYKADLESGLLKCEICYDEKGNYRHTVRHMQCSVCSQVNLQNAENPTCFCETKAPFLSIQKDPFGKWTKGKKEVPLKVEIDSDKRLREKFHEAYDDNRERPKRMEEKLDKMCDLLEKLLEQKNV